MHRSITCPKNRATNGATQRFSVMRRVSTTEPVQPRGVRTWVLTHLFRIWTALITLIGIGWSFLYKPEWLTWWLRTTMAGIEQACALLPYPWGDRVEVAIRGIGASFWIQITLVIIIVRVIAWMIGYIWRHSR
jgi:hypothetical protein